MNKKRKVSKRKVGKFVAVLVVIIILLVAIVLLYNNLFGKGKTSTKEVKVEDSLEEYGYQLNENETAYYKKLYKNLKKELTKDSVDEEEYAKLISQLFITDFYSLSNSSSKNDVGGVQFIYSDFQDDFVKLAKESVYKTVKSNIYGDRKQELPTVSSVIVNDIKQESYEYANTEDDAAYIVDLSIEYKEDMKYQSDVSLIIIHTGDKKLEIAEMK